MMRVKTADGDIVIDAGLLAPLLDVPNLMRRQSMTGICERGIAPHEGQYRLSFFHRNRRVDGNARP
jgi:hypothetical protein